MVDALTSPILRFYMASLQVEGTSATDLGRGLLERSLSALGAQAPLGSSSSAAAGVGVWGRTGGGGRPRCSVACTRQVFAAGVPVPRFKAPTESKAEGAAGRGQGAAGAVVAGAVRRQPTEAGVVAKRHRGGASEIRGINREISKNRIKVKNVSVFASIGNSGNTR